MTRKPYRVPKEMGGPPKLSKAKIDRICQAVRIGSYLETAAAFVGVHESTLHRWRSRGRTEREAGIESVYTEFVDRLDQALAEADIRDLAVIRSAAEAGIWQAAAWRLERAHPEQWGRRTVEVTGPGGQPIPTAFEITVIGSRDLTEDEFLHGVRTPTAGPRQ